MSYGRGAFLITQERLRQIEVEGWTPEHDAEHDDRELTAAATCYLSQSIQPVTAAEQREIEECWPWDKSYWKPSDDPIRNLVKAGALIAAEIDRIQATRSNP